MQRILPRGHTIRKSKAAPQGRLCLLTDSEVGQLCELCLAQGTFTKSSRTCRCQTPGPWPCAVPKMYSAAETQPAVGAGRGERGGEKV